MFFPNELWAIILQYMTVSDYHSLSLTSKHMRLVTHDLMPKSVWGKTQSARVVRVWHRVQFVLRLVGPMRLCSIPRNVSVLHVRHIHVFDLKVPHPHLKELYLRDCRIVRNLDLCPNLTKLSIALGSISCIKDLIHLQHLELKYVDDFRKLSNLPTLSHIELTHAFPEFGHTIQAENVAYPESFIIHPGRSSQYILISRNSWLDSILDPHSPAYVKNSDQNLIMTTRHDAGAEEWLFTVRFAI